MGGISIALAMKTPEFPGRNAVLTVTYVIVVFSIVVQGLRGLDPEPGLRHPDMPVLLCALEPGATPHTELAAIRARIHRLEPGVLRYHEVPVPSALSVQVMRAELSRLTADGAAYALVVELEEANMPGLAVRERIIEMFSDPHLEFVALLTGGDPVKVLSATLIVGQVVAPGRFAMVETLPAALAACRAALARQAARP